MLEGNAIGAIIADDYACANEAFPCQSPLHRCIHGMGIDPDMAAESGSI